MVMQSLTRHLCLPVAIPCRHGFYPSITNFPHIYTTLGALTDSSKINLIPLQFPCGRVKRFLKNNTQNKMRVGAKGMLNILLAPLSVLTIHSCCLRHGRP